MLDQHPQPRYFGAADHCAAHAAGLQGAPLTIRRPIHAIVASSSQAASRSQRFTLHAGADAWALLEWIGGLSVVVQSHEKVTLLAQVFEEYFERVAGRWQGRR